VGHFVVLATKGGKDELFEDEEEWPAGSFERRGQSVSYARKMLQSVLEGEANRLAIEGSYP